MYCEITVCLSHFSLEIITYVNSLSTFTFLGAFAKLRKGTISFVMSVRQSVRMEQLGSHYTDFHEILYLNVLRKSVEKIQVSLKSDNITDTLHFFYHIPRNSS
jgi:hypothetical protein